MAYAKKIRIKGYKSFADTGVKLNDGVNLLLGANGAGKSNFISFFRFLNRLVEEQLYRHTGEIGGADAILHKGPPRSAIIEADLAVGDNEYQFQLVRTEDNRFIFEEETAVWLYNDHRVELARAGAAESALKKHPKQTSQYTYKYLSGIRVFHFHDTSSDAPVMGAEPKENSSSLMGDARNLAALLWRLRESDPAVYEHIRATIQLIAPFFDDFELKPDRSGRVSLRWRQAGLAEEVFGPNAFSDGTLRFVCLATLLNQPDEDLPKLILIDEPELGLHPHAIQVLAEMLKAAGARTQLIVATQSASLVDQFLPDNVIVAAREDGATTLKRLDEEQLRVWLEDYTLGEIWRKNLLGGTPL